jgi:hypothetical protein
MNGFTLIPITLLILSCVWMFMSGKKGGKSTGFSILLSAVGAGIFIFGTHLVTRYIIPRSWYMKIGPDWPLVLSAMVLVFLSVVGLGMIIRKKIVTTEKVEEL